eukprot:169683-Rhodomonas_salina.1
MSASSSTLTSFNPPAVPNMQAQVRPRRIAASRVAQYRDTAIKSEEKKALQYSSVLGACCCCVCARAR